MALIDMFLWINAISILAVLVAAVGIGIAAGVLWVCRAIACCLRWLRRQIMPARSER